MSLAMDICRQRSVDKRVYCGTHCDTPRLHNGVLFPIGGEVARAEGKYEGSEKTEHALSHLTGPFSQVF